MTHLAAGGGGRGGILVARGGCLRGGGGGRGGNLVKEVFVINLFEIRVRERNATLQQKLDHSRGRQRVEVACKHTQHCYRISLNRSRPRI